jgi:hypothetical protein
VEIKILHVGGVQISTVKIRTEDTVAMEITLGMIAILLLPPMPVAETVQIFDRVKILARTI